MCWLDHFYCLLINSVLDKFSNFKEKRPVHFEKYVNFNVQGFLYSLTTEGIARPLTDRQDM